MGRGHSDLQVLSGCLRPGRESHGRFPTWDQAMMLSAIGTALSRDNGLAGHSSPDSPCAPLLLTHPAAESQVPLLFLAPARHTLPLPWMCPPPASFFSQISMRFTPSSPSDVCIKFPFSVRLTLTTIFIVTILHASNPAFIHSAYFIIYYLLSVFSIII